MGELQETHDKIGWIRDLARDEPSARSLLRTIGIETGEYKNGCFENCYTSVNGVQKLKKYEKRFQFSFIPLKNET